MKILFIRHGETTWNVEKRLQGQTNESKLTENGIKMAKELEATKNNLDYDIIISSPLERTIKTAEIINSIKKKKIILDDRIIERGYGKLEGKYAYAGDYNINDFWDFDKDYSENEVEPVSHLFKRVYEFIDELIKQKEYNKILIVSHSGVAIAFRTYFEHISKNGDLLSLKIGNCEILKYDIGTEILA